jgi:O-antigen/teichoic acid export membrane protein
MRRLIPDIFLRIGRRLYPDGSLRGIVTLSSGSVVGQIILAASSPIVSRLYTPGEFGVFSIFFSTFGIVSIVSTLQYQNAIPLPKRDRDGARVLIAVLVVLGLFSLGLWILIAFLGDFFVDAANLQIEHYLIWILPAAVALANANSCLQFWFLRKREYSSLAIVKGVQSISMAGGQIGFGLMHFGAAGLIVGHLLGQAAGIFQLTTGVLSRYRKLFLGIGVAQLFDVLFKYRSYATVFTPSALLGASTVYLPAIMLGILYDPTVAGIFAFSLQVSKAGMSIILQSVSRVFLVTSIEDFNNGNSERIKKRAIRFSISQFLIGAPVFLALFLFGANIFHYIFGPSWALGGVYIVLLTPHLFAFFVFDHLVTLFVVTSSHKSKLFWDGMKFLVLIGTFVAAWSQQFDPEKTILLLSCGWGILYLLLIPVTFSSLKSSSAESHMLG